MLLPRFHYTFSMDRRKEAVQATIEEFVKSMISSKSDKRNVYSDSYSSYCGEQDAPSPTLLKKILMGYPIWNLYILDFIFRMMWRHQVVYVLVHGGLLVGEVIILWILRMKYHVNFKYSCQKVLCNIVKLRVVPITTVFCYLGKLNIKSDYQIRSDLV